MKLLFYKSYGMFVKLMSECLEPKTKVYLVKNNNKHN